jgi:NDP-4-keto-2,6-dideoxyhexose 3-C-methyltransferase
MDGTAVTHRSRTTCRACGEGPLTEILDLGMQYLPRWVKEIDYALPKAPLTLVHCDNCGLLQLRDTADPALLFTQFWYRSAMNKTMRDALYDIVVQVTEHVQEGTWLDIGANDGYLLSEVPLIQFKRIACEPALNFREELLRITPNVISDYFSAEALDGETCDVITSAAMFYDLDDPNAFIADIAKCLKPGGIWVNQLNDAPTMLKANAFDAICHEHLCYYDIPTLERMYARHGLGITRMSHNDVNGGSIRVTATKTNRKIPALVGAESVSRMKADKFARRVSLWKNRMQEFLSTCRGPVWAYGASTKGGTLLQYLDMPQRIVAVADKNP